RIDVPKRGRLSRDDMDVDAEAVSVEADRLLNALCPVDRVERWMGVEDDLPILVDSVLAGAEQLINVSLLDRVPAKLDLDVGDVADEAAGAIACPHVLDREPGHAFGELDSFAHRELACGHV